MISIISASLAALLLAAPTQPKPPEPPPFAIVAQPASSCADGWEPDDSIVLSRAILPGELQGHTLHVENDVDFVTVTLRQGQKATVTTSNLIGATDTILHLYDRDGTLIAINDDVNYYGGDRSSAITWTAVYDGPYYARAKDFYWRGGCDASAFGYSLSLAVYQQLWLPVIWR